MTDTLDATGRVRNIAGGFVGDTPTKAVLDALNNTLKAIRVKHPDLGAVALVVGASGRTRTGFNHGHFSADRWATSKGGKAHEIMLSGESLKRGPEETLGTLLHECAHYIAAERNIKDTSRQGRFHNKKFKELAEEVGIRVHHDRSIGWSVTTLPAETAKAYKAELSALRKALKTYRIEEGPAAPRKKTTVKLATPSGRSVTVPIKFYEAGDIFDSVTGETFLPVEEEAGDE